jgi:hypothetical protein
MDKTGTVFLFTTQDLNGAFQLAVAHLDPTSLGGDPAISNISINPSYILTEARSTTTISAAVSASSKPAGVSEAFLRGGVSETGYFTDQQLYDDGTNGDVTAGDGIYTNNHITINYDPPTGPRTVRVSAETVDGNGLQHVTAVEVDGLTVVTQAPAANLQFSASDFNVNESAGTATVTVTRTGDSSGSVTVHYATSDGSAHAGTDYTATSGDLTFAAGETSKTISVPLLDDPDVAASEGFTVTLTNPGGGASLGSPAAATVTIADTDAPLTVSPPAAVPSPTEGKAFSGAVASFTGTGTAASFSATVNWGDGPPDTSATIAAGSGGAFAVSDAHTYAEEGAYTVTVTVRDGAGNTQSTSSTVTVADAALTLTASTPPVAVEGTPVNGVVVASFTDANPGARAADFSATITWGDGSTSAGTVVASGGGFDVQGAHTYATAGNFPLAVVIKDVGGSRLNFSGSAVVNDAALSAVVSSIAPTAGTPFSGAVGVVTDTNSNATGSDLTATISWGDGHTTAGSLVALGGGRFEVRSSNTYSTSGTFMLVLAVHDNGGATASSGNPVFVATPPSPPAHGVTARLATARVGRKKFLVIEVLSADGGQMLSKFRCPFQKPMYKNIQVTVRDTAGDGMREEVVVTAQKGKKTVMAVFPV